VSYPRSGTTLTQWLLLCLLREPGDQTAHLNELSPWFERSLASGTLSAAEIERFADPRVFKSHLLPRWLPAGPRYVAVVRDGADVAVSYHHFYRDYLGFDGSPSEFFERFRNGDLQYGAWSQHVDEWRERAADKGDTLVIRYEDLVADRARVARALVAFLEWPADRVERAVELTSFDAMKAREAQFDHATALLLERGVTPRSFLRRGQVGEGSTLSNAQRAELGRRSTPRRARLSAFLR
jgi:hypothetical protein